MNQVDSKRWGSDYQRRKFLVSASEVDPAMANLSRLALVVFIIATIAVWYYYARYADDEIKLGSGISLPTSAENADPVTSSLERQGTSDEVSDIEQDLNATNLDGLDRELADINAGLQ